MEEEGALDLDYRADAAAVSQIVETLINLLKGAAAGNHTFHIQQALFPESDQAWNFVQGITGAE